MGDFIAANLATLSLQQLFKVHLGGGQVFAYPLGQNLWFYPHRRDGRVRRPLLTQDRKLRLSKAVRTCPA